MTEDSVDRTLKQWAEHWPGVELGGRQIVWRLQLITKYMQARIDASIGDKSKLSLSSYKALMTLRAQQPPHQMTPTAIARALSMTSGATTNLIDRIEKAGLVRRSRDPVDRRGVLVTLTDAGYALAEDLQESYEATERELLAPLDDADRELLTNLLRKLLAAYEREDPSVALTTLAEAEDEG